MGLAETGNSAGGEHNVTVQSPHLSTQTVLLTGWNIFWICPQKALVREDSLLDGKTIRRREQ